MNDINNITFSGRLIKEIEIFQTKSEYAVISLSVANNYSEKQNNEWVEKTNFFNCKIFCKGKQFDYYNNNLRKGLLVTISGSTKTETWQQDGQNRSKQIIMCDKIIFASEPIQNNKSNRPQQQSQEIPDPWGDSTPNNKSYKQQQDDDDIPF